MDDVIVVGGARVWVGVAQLAIELVLAASGMARHEEIMPA